MKFVLLKRLSLLLMLCALSSLFLPVTSSASTNDAVTTFSQAQDPVNRLPRLMVSKDGHFFVTETGEPFFWLGDTAWEMFARLTREEVEQYLENRRMKGFNVIQVVILTEHSLNTPNAYGDVAIANNNPLRPNEDYFKFVDWMIKQAAAKGLYVGLLPTWGDKVNKLQGKGPVIFNTDNAQRYAAYLGKRYRAATNIIWILGGDRNVQNKTQLAIWRAMAAGIEAEAGADALITYHPRGESSSAEWFHGDANIDFNMLQSGHNHHDFPVWDLVTESYQLAPAKPVLDGEINYEDSPVDLKAQNGYFTAYDVRKQAYRSVFAGASGVTYGHHAVWQFYSPDRRGIASPLAYWYDSLDRPGAMQLQYLTNLMLSRPYLERVPDQALLQSSEPALPAAHMQTTRASNGSYAFIYLPVNQAVTVDLTQISGEVVRAWWYDPRTGQSLLIGEFIKADQTSLTLTPPAAYEDSVLVLDDASQTFAPPGGHNSGIDTVRRAINLNGPAALIQNRQWEAGSAAAISLRRASTFCNQNVALTPATDAATARMIRCSVYGEELELVLNNVPNGTYEVALTIWEDNAAEGFNIEIEGQMAVVNHNSGVMGTWARLVFSDITVSDNQLHIVTSGGHANLSGLEIWPSEVDDN
jgi:hypothetical protein